MSALAIAAPARLDADILAAWQRMKEARQAIDALDDSDKDGDLWDAFGRDEHVIQGATAATIEGAEIQLWCHLLHTVPSADEERAVLHRDLARFIDREREYDWTERLVFSAIRSLRAMGGIVNAPTASLIKGEIDISLTFIACAKPLLTRLDDALVGGGDAPRELLSGLADEALALLLDAERYATSASEMLGVVTEGGAA